MKRWYHYFMLPFVGQLGLLVVAGILFFFQAMIYDGIEEDIVQFEGECEITRVMTDDEEPEFSHMAGMCGDERVAMTSRQQTNYLLALTEGNESVMLCEKTESEYLKEVNWKCEVNTYDKRTQHSHAERQHTSCASSSGLDSA